MTCGIYSLVNAKTRSEYIGQSKNLEHRTRFAHRSDADAGSHFPIHRAIRKYGWEAFECVVLEECEESLLNDREQYWVAERKTAGVRLYNAKPAGQNNGKISKASRDVISFKALHRWEQSPDLKARYAERMTLKNPMLREEVRAKVSRSQRLVWTPEKRAALGATQRARLAAPGMSERMSKIQKEAWANSPNRERMRTHNPMKDPTTAARAGVRIKAALVARKAAGLPIGRPKKLTTGD